MKKLLSSLLVLAAFMVAVPASAKVFGFGVTGGLNVSKLDVDGAKNNTGWFAGLSAKVTIPIVGLGVDGALLFSQEKLGTEAQTDNVNYLSIPVNLRYDLQLPVVSKFIVPFAFAGPQFDYALSDSFDLGEMDWDVKSSSWRANFGIGAILLNHLQVSYAYSLGLNDTYKESVVGGLRQDATGDSKSKTHKIALTYFF